MTEIPARVDGPVLRAFTSAGYTNLEQLLSVHAKKRRALHGIVGPKATRIFAMKPNDARRSPKSSLTLADPPLTLSGP